MLTQVILVMRTPFKSQGAIGAQEGPHSSVDALMNLGVVRVKYASLKFAFYFLHIGVVIYIM